MHVMMAEFYLAASGAGILLYSSKCYLFSVNLG